MGKLTVHEFDPVIYPRVIWVVRGEGIEEDIRNAFLSTDGSPLDTTGWRNAKAGTWGAQESNGGRLGVLVWLITDDIGVEDVSHESVHAANCIFRDCGIGYDVNNDEHFAFLVGKIANWIWRTFSGEYDVK